MASHIISLEKDRPEYNKLRLNGCIEFYTDERVADSWKKSLSQNLKKIEVVIKTN